MINKISKKFLYSAISLTMAMNLSACGGESPATAELMAAKAAYQAMYNQLQAQIKENEADCCCDDGSTSTATTESNSSSTKTSTTKTPVTKTTTDKKETTTPTKTDTKTETKTETPSTTITPRQMVDKVLNTVISPVAYQVDLEKYEKSLKDPSKFAQQTLKVYVKKPNVKIDVIAHTKPSNVGAKLTYKNGSGKATIRPGGALSFITKEFDMLDDNITTPNDYGPDQVDFISLSNRLSSTDYKAELTGKTTIDGTEVYLMKLTTSGTNALDTKIKYEIVGFSPKTWEVKLWEAYADGDEPYIRTTIKSFTPLSDLPDSTFKV